MQPTQPPTVPPQAPPYYPYPAAPAAMGPTVINKRMVFAIVAVGLLLIFVAQLGLQALRLGGAGGSAMRALYYTGALIGTGGAMLGALASPRTDGNQKLGLLILAGFLILALTSRAF